MTHSTQVFERSSALSKRLRAEPQTENRIDRKLAITLGEAAWQSTFFGESDHENHVAYFVLPKALHGKVAADDCDRQLVALGHLSDLSVARFIAGTNALYNSSNCLRGSYQRDVLIHATTQILNKILTKGTFAFERRDPWTSLATRLESFSDVQQSLYPDGDVPALRRAIDEAMTVVNRISSFKNPPLATLSSDGEIALFWRRPDDYLELSFFGEGVLYFSRKGNSNTQSVNEMWESDDMQDLPTSLISLIAEFSNF